MKKILILVVLLLSFAIVGAAYAAESYPWNDHAAPYDFAFGNHFDTHQQSKENGQDQLGGFFYISFTGDSEKGAPVAKHADCKNDPNDCSVGWKLKGVKVEATVASNGPGHPTWCVEPEDMPKPPGYSHFHWLGQPEHAHDLQVGDTFEGYLLKLTAVDHFYFDHHGGFLVTPGIDTASHANLDADC